MARRLTRLPLERWHGARLARILGCPAHLVDQLKRSTGLRCCNCLKLCQSEADLAAHPNCVDRGIAILPGGQAGVSPAFRQAALAWARGVDAIEELSRRRPLHGSAAPAPDAVVPDCVEALLTPVRILLVDTEDAAGWNTLALFHVMCFTPVEEQLRVHPPPPAFACMQRRLRRFTRGEWAALLTEANEAEVSELQRLSRQQRFPRSEDGDIDTASRLAGAGRLSDAMSRLRVAFAPVCEPPFETSHAKMRSLNPQARHPLPPCPADARGPDLAFECFESAVRKLSSDASPGCSGLPDWLLRSCLLHDSQLGALLLDSFFLLVRDILGGHIPGLAADLIAFTRLVSIPKPVEPPAPPGARPIGIGEPIRKLAAASYLQLRGSAIRAAYSPIQHCAAPGSVDLAHSTARRIMACHPGALVVQLDIANAYGTISRARVAEWLTHSPFADLLPFFHVCYGKSRPMLFRHRDAPSGFAYVPSQEGTHQGCLIAQLCFCGPVQPILMRLFGPRGKYAGRIACIADADDILLLSLSPGSAEQENATMALALGELERALTDLGALFNHAKCLAARLCGPGQPLCAPPPPSVLSDPRAWPHVRGQPLCFEAVGLKYLGAPYYSHHPRGHAYARAFFSSTLDSISFDLDCIRKATLRPLGRNSLSPRHAWLLITRCAQPRWQHLLRACRPDGRLFEACVEFDLRLSDAAVHTLIGVPLRRLLDGQPHPLVSLFHGQIRMPVRLTGIGLRSSVHLAVAASLAVDVSLTQEACHHLAVHGNRYAADSFLSADFGDVVAWLRRCPRLATLHRIGSVQDLINRLIHVGETGGQPEEGPENDRADPAQAMFSCALEDLAFDHLHREACTSDPSSAARLLCLRDAPLAISSGWFTHHPPFGLPDLRPPSFRLSLCFRFGVNPAQCGVVRRVTRCGGAITCSATLDDSMHHLFRCNTGPRSTLHNDIARALWRYVHHSPGIPTLEAFVEERDTVRESRERPFDIMFRGDLGSPPLSAGCLCVDLTIRHEALPSFAIKGRASTDPAISLADAAARKRAAFGKLVHAGRVNLQDEYVYHPWAISTYGNIHPEFLGDLRRLAALRAGCALTGSTSKLSQREKREFRLLLAYLSYHFQGALLSFFRKRVAQCE